MAHLNNPKSASKPLTSKSIPLLCRIGWHTPGRNLGNITMFDGMSLHGICKRCGKDIMQDSQGGWF